MKFKFRYQKILDFRKKAEDEKKQLMAVAATHYNKVVESINILEENKKSSQSTLIGQQSLNNLGDRAYISNYIESIKEQVQRLEDQKGDLLLKLEEAKAVYLEAKKDVTVFEHLKEKAQNIFYLEQKKKEQQELDFYGREIFARKQEKD